VNLTVWDPTAPTGALAVLSYGWESAEYYARHSDAAADRASGIVLDPLHRQSEHAPAVLAMIEDALRDPVRAARIRRHYQLFKATPEELETELTVPEVLAELARNYGRFPTAAVRAAVRFRDELTPLLLASLEQAAGRAEAGEGAGEDFLPIYAMFLLAQFRDPRAYPPLIRIARLPGDRAEELLGDVLTEDFCRLLAAVCGADLGPIKALAEDSSAHEFARSAAIRSVNVLVRAGSLSRDEALAYYRHLLRAGLERAPSAAWTSVIVALMDLHPGELMEEIRSAFGSGFIDPGCIDESEVEFQATRPVDEVLREFHEREEGLIEDAVDHMAWWSCFQEEDEYDGSSSDADLFDDERAPELPFRRTEPKIGRNEPCPCGSGRKYKRCCGQP
jgi:hypothetical protein